MPRPSLKPPTAEAKRRESLRQARQRIVELQAVRAYAQETSDAGALLTRVDLLLAEALALEQALIAHGKPAAPPGRRGRTRPLAAALLVATWMIDDKILAWADLAWSVPVAF